MTSSNKTNADVVAGLNNIMNDYYPKYLANPNQCAVIFVVDNTGSSNGRNVENNRNWDSILF